MMEFTEIEEKAAAAAMEQAGEYLDWAVNSGAGSDFAQWSSEMYEEFIKVICSAFETYMAENPPF